MSVDKILDGRMKASRLRSTIRNVPYESELDRVLGKILRFICVIPRLSVERILEGRTVRTELKLSCPIEDVGAIELGRIVFRP